MFGLVKLNPDLFWPAILVATAGNTLGGAVTWWMGYGAERAYEQHDAQARPRRARCAGCERFGAEGLPAVLAAGRRRPAVRGGRLAASCRSGPASLYMAIGKFARYVDDDGGCCGVFPGQYSR